MYVGQPKVDVEELRRMTAAAELHMAKERDRKAREASDARRNAAAREADRMIARAATKVQAVAERGGHTYDVYEVEDPALPDQELVLDIVRHWCERQGFEVRMERKPVPEQASDSGKEPRTFVEDPPSDHSVIVRMAKVLVVVW